MTLINIKEKDNFCVDNKRVQIKFNLIPGKLIRLIGANGVGKSSFIQYLKLNQDSFFINKKVSYLDQQRLLPLNDVSLNDLKELLLKKRYEILKCIDVIEEETSFFSSKPIKELSGGQNQLVKIYLSLFLSGDVFILDEPFQFLDEKNQQKMLKIIGQLKSLNKEILIVEHHFDLKDIVDEKVELQSEKKWT